MSSSIASVLRLEAVTPRWPRRLWALACGALVGLAMMFSAAPLWSVLIALLTTATLWRSKDGGPAALSLSGRRVEQSGSAVGAELYDHAWLGPLLSLRLHLDDGRRRSLLYGPWNLSADQRRRLRLHLRRLEATN